MVTKKVTGSIKQVKCRRSIIVVQPTTNRLNFGGDPVQDPDPGIFQGFFTIAR